MKVVFVAVLSLFVIHSSCQKKPEPKVLSPSETVDNYLHAIPNEDQRMIASFFELLMREYDFAYTLFGEKPMSMACYYDTINANSIHYPIEFLVFEKGWEEWQRYSLDFPSDIFVLKKCTDNRNISEIFLIHKKHTFEAISKNFSLFQEILGDSIKPEQILYQLCRPDTDTMEVIGNHTALLGILLGYGKNNSLHFERKRAICEKLNRKMTPPFSAMEGMKALEPESKYLVGFYKTKSYPPNDSTFSVDAIALAEELNNVMRNEETFCLEGSDFFLDTFIAPIFVTKNNDLETKQLHESYLRTKQKIYEAYERGPFLEVTLNQWMNPK